MNADNIFSILAIICGIYFVIRLFAHRQFQSTKSIFLLVSGCTLIIVGFCGFIFKSTTYFSAILLGIVLIIQMIKQERSWRGHRFTTAYGMHCSGWILGIGSTIYGILNLLP